MISKPRPQEALSLLKRPAGGVVGIGDLQVTKCPCSPESRFTEGKDKDCVQKNVRRLAFS